MWTEIGCSLKKTYIKINTTVAFIEVEKTPKRSGDPFCRESPEEKESLSYKEGHFETQQETSYNTISTAALIVANQ